MPTGNVCTVCGHGFGLFQRREGTCDKCGVFLCSACCRKVAARRLCPQCAREAAAAPASESASESASASASASASHSSPSHTQQHGPHHKPPTHNEPPLGGDELPSWVRQQIKGGHATTYATGATTNIQSRYRNNSAAQPNEELPLWMRKKIEEEGLTVTPAATADPGAATPAEASDIPKPTVGGVPFDDLPVWYRDQLIHRALAPGVAQSAPVKPFIMPDPGAAAPAETSDIPKPTVGGVPFDDLPVWYRDQLIHRALAPGVAQSAPVKPFIMPAASAAVASTRDPALPSATAHPHAQPQGLPHQGMARRSSTASPPPGTAAEEQLAAAPTASSSQAPAAAAPAAAKPPNEAEQWAALRARLESLTAEMTPYRRPAPPSMDNLQRRLDQLKGTRDPSQPLPTASELEKRLFELSEGRHGLPAFSEQMKQHPLPPKPMSEEEEVNELWAQVLDETELANGLPPGSLSVPADQAAAAAGEPRSSGGQPADDSDTSFLTASLRANPADDSLHLSPELKAELAAWAREANAASNGNELDAEARHTLDQVQELLARPLTDSPPINVNQELGIEGDNDGSNSASAGPQRAAQAKNQKQTSSSSKDPGERQPHGAEEDTASLNEEAEAIVAQALQEDDADSDRPPAPSGEAL